MILCEAYMLGYELILQVVTVLVMTLYCMYLHTYVCIDSYGY